METNQGVYSGFILMLVFIVLGYFIYGGVDGAAGIFLLYVLGGVTILIALIPFAGVFIQYIVFTMYLMPYIFELTGIYSTWLTTVILAFSIVLGAIVTLFTSAAILGLHR